MIQVAAEARRLEAVPASILGLPVIIQVVLDHDLVLKTMVHWGSPMVQIHIEIIYVRGSPMVSRIW